MTSSTDSQRDPEREPQAAAGFALAGRVGRPHGLNGAFHVSEPRTRLLAAAATVRLGGRCYVVAARAGTDRSPLIRLRGVEDRDAAQALGGLQIEVESEGLPDLGPGEWWAHELEGCVIVDGEAVLGTVVRLLELPSCEALEVRRPRGRSLLVPMVSDAIRSVDVSRRRIEVDGSFLGEQA